MKSVSICRSSISLPTLSERGVEPKVPLPIPTEDLIPPPLTLNRSPALSADVLVCNQTSPSSLSPSVFAVPRSPRISELLVPNSFVLLGPSPPRVTGSAFVSPTRGVCRSLGFPTLHSRLPSGAGASISCPLVLREGSPTDGEWLSRRSKIRCRGLVALLMPPGFYQVFEGVLQATLHYSLSLGLYGIAANINPSISPPALP